MTEVLFDIDKTLFNSSVLMEGFNNRLSIETGVEVSTLINIYSDYISGLESRTDFEPSGFIKKLANETRIETKILNDIFFDKRIYKKALYPEVIDVLKELKQSGISMGTFSEGRVNFQMEKLEMAGINHFFEGPMIIERRKLSDESINRIPEGSIIIDDKRDVVEKLHLFKKFKLFWINRNDNEKIPGIKTINNLLEITK